MESFKEKQILFRALTGLVGVATLVLVYMVLWGALLPKEQYPARTISVSASGKTIVKPDVAIVSLSVVSEGKDTQAISDYNNNKIKKVIDFLKEQGVDEKDIKTTEYNLYPVYSQQARLSDSTFVPIIMSYSLTQTIQVKIRDFSKISDIIGELAPLGINRISNIVLSVDDPEVYQATARAEAINKAKEKAKAMADELGVSLGKVVSISEYAQDSGPVYPVMAKTVNMGRMESASVPAPIEAGSQEIVVNANISFEIK